MDSLRWRSVVACAAGVACLTLTAAACSSNSSSSSSSTATTSAPASSSAAATTAPATTPAATPTASATTPAAASPAETEKTIAANWVAFFNPKTSVATKVSLLQDGAKFGPTLEAALKSSYTSSVSAKVVAVTLAGATSANVTWDLLLSGNPALSNQKGTAVLDGGTWKVSDASYCGLLSLQPPVPAACKS